MVIRRSLDLIERTTTRDRAVAFRDGSWGTVRVQPPGLGWHVLRDHERRTVWWRRRVVVRLPVRP